MSRLFSMNLSILQESSKPRSDLPFAAKGIEFEDFYIQFQKNKIVFGSRNPIESHYHFTLIFGRSGVVDLHRKNRDGSYETLAMININDIPQLLEHVNSQIEFWMPNLIRKVRIGWLYHHQILIVSGEYPAEADFTTLLKVGRKRRLVLDKDALLKQLREIEWYDDLLDFPDGCFGMYTMKRRAMKRIGTLMKFTDAAGRSRFYWIKFRDLNKLLRAIREDFTSKLWISDEGEKLID